MRTPTIHLLLLLASLALSGCASTNHNPQDPFETFNRGVYKINDTVDRAVVKPVAKGYNAVMPTAGKLMISSFFSNLNDVIVAVNDLLQFKVTDAISDTGRIAVNTTFGLYGIADVASAIGLKKHKEDFGQTLGHWGMGSGPYLVLPLLGPSSVLDKRASLFAQESVLDEASFDRYAFLRDAYLQHRRSEVYDGNPPREKYDDEGDDKPDQHSTNGGDLHGIPVVADLRKFDSPAISSDDLNQPHPGVHHIWVSQTNGARESH